MTNPWVEHVRKYAKEKGISYGCAVTEASATYTKKAKTSKKPKSAPAPASAKAPTPAKSPPKAPVKAKPSPKKNLEMPDEVGKLIQDLARPNKKTVVAAFTTNYEDYYVIMNDGTILLLSNTQSAPIQVRKEKSMEDAWNWIKKNIRGLQFFNYTYNMIESEEDPIVKKYGLTVSNPPTETKVLFYHAFAGETLARQLAEQKYETAARMIV